MVISSAVGTGVFLGDWKKVKVTAIAAVGLRNLLLLIQQLVIYGGSPFAMSGVSCFVAFNPLAKGYIKGLFVWFWAGASTAFRYLIGLLKQAYF